MPKVSIITAAYNSAAFIKTAIDSVVNQTYQDFELIVVDDGSKDETRKMVECYSKDAKIKIRYIYQENGGPSKARNCAFKEAQGDYIAILDADDSWMPTRLEEGVNVLDSNPDIGFVHANIIGVDESGQAIKSFKRENQYLSGRIFVHLFLRKADIASPTVLFRKSVCDSVGVFDENLTRLGSEDRDLWLRIAQKFEVHYIDQALAYYRIRSQSMSHDYTNMLKGRLYIIDKYTPQGTGNQRLRKQALAKIYRDMGDIFLFEKRFTQANAYYQKAIQYNPLSVWPWFNLLKSKFKLEVNHV